MLAIDRKEFAAAIAEMFAAHGRNVTEPALNGWWDALKDLQDTRLVLTSIREAIKYQDRLPVPKNVRDWYVSHRTVAPFERPPASPGDKNWPFPSEVMIARRILKDPRFGAAAILDNPRMGQAMLDYLRAHPEPSAAPARAGPCAETVDALVLEARAQLARDVVELPGEEPF